ncbi:MAG: phage Gp37/Gp68 family protein [candidate division Zixibacteria bacterium]|nr:phage Gp37/Gp68 family protein [candidate division Zixibacteria bacterium]
MSQKSAIEWTESTWNPVTGCDKVSAGCQNCYAERMAKRLKAMGSPNYINGFTVTLHPDTLGLPLSWKKPQMIFVNSMSDLFHDKVPLKFVKQVFEVMNEASQHQFQILTKRSARLLKLHEKLNWTENIWMGVSVENNRCTNRIDHLRETNAKTKFLSLEPLLGPLPKLNLSNIDWAIVGGESGPKSRPMKTEWVLDIRDQCHKKKVPFFFKQWGGFNKKKNGRILEGRTWDEVPHQLLKRSA